MEILQMATTTTTIASSSARGGAPRYEAMLLTNLHHHHYAQPSARGRPWPPSKLFKQTAAQTLARAQTQESGEPGDPNRQQPKKPAALMNAFERAAAYKKNKANPPATDQATAPASPAAELDVSVENQKPIEGVTLEDISPEFKSLKSKQESEMASALATKAELQKVESNQADSSQALEVEIITRDGVIRRKVTRPSEAFSKSKMPKRTGVSSSDFMGLDFAEKKSTAKGALPAGLAVGLEAPPPGSLPEVEIITRDGKAQQASKDGLYKPKVATWGIFERPADISKTYGGGRTIKPGEQLETEEERKARDARTKELLAAYYKKIGVNVDPQIKADCTKALKQGNEFFERGSLQRALEQFEKVMQQMPYQSELHGLAALQWAVCLDSSNRFQEAREMYEKILSHPNVTVRKKAKQLLYGFQAMETLKVSTGPKWDSSVYRRYFDAFAANDYSLYKPSEEETDDGSLREQAFIYLGLLLFPLVLFLLVVALKGR